MGSKISFTEMRKLKLEKARQKVSGQSTSSTLPTTPTVIPTITSEKLPVSPPSPPSKKQNAFTANNEKDHPSKIEAEKKDLYTSLLIPL